MFLLPQFIARVFYNIVVIDIRACILAIIITFVYDFLTAVKYFIEYYDRKKKQERKWVPENQLEVIENPLPSKPGEDISKKAIYTYKASGKSIPFETHILKVECKLSTMLS